MICMSIMKFPTPIVLLVALILPSIQRWHPSYKVVPSQPVAQATVCSQDLSPWWALQPLRR
ncbi:hypothetical protein BJX66DRAFT_316280 [Aspergillus keveii]|uniref:Secreted protein n=1 Tax=Aspergillus keveii TaxID=714993 RepID=A0ABR4FN63_9EURO